jgi:hypothetical protein
MNLASSGVAIGPPWHSTMMSLSTWRAAAAQALISGGQSASFTPVSAPILPPVVRPMWQTMMSAPASAMAMASRSLKT